MNTSGIANASPKLCERIAYLCFSTHESGRLPSNKVLHLLLERDYGTIVALNAGIPALVTNGDMRAKEVTDYLGIPLSPGICGSDFDLRELYELFDTDAINRRYDAVFTNYCDWLHLNGLSYSQGSQAICSDIVHIQLPRTVRRSKTSNIASVGAGSRERQRTAAPGLCVPEFPRVAGSV